MDDKKNDDGVHCRRGRIARKLDGLDKNGQGKEGSLWGEGGH